MKNYIAVFLFWAVFLFSAVCIFADEDEKATNATRVENAYSSYINALLSDNEETRVKAIKQYLPTAKEVSRIWKDEQEAGIAWKMIKSWSDDLIANNKKVNAELTAGGVLVGVRAEEYRKTKKDIVTQAVPETMPLFIVHSKHSEASSTTYSVIINQRVVFIENLVQICRKFEKK